MVIEKAPTNKQKVTNRQLIILVLYLIPLAIISTYPLIFSQYGEVYLLTSYGSLIAYFIMGAALIAIGVFVSSLTENQGLSAIFFPRSALSADFLARSLSQPEICFNLLAVVEADVREVMLFSVELIFLLSSAHFLSTSAFFFSKPAISFVKWYRGVKRKRLHGDHFRITVEPVIVKRYRKTLANRGFCKKKLDTRFDTHCIKTGVQLWCG